MIACKSLHRKAKSRINGLAALLLIAGFGGAAQAQLQLRYTFEPNGSPPDTVTLINDRSGNNNNGTSITASESAFVAGPSGNMNAIHLDCDDFDDSTKGSGISTGVDTLTIGITDNDFTVMAWVNREILKGDNMVFGTGSDDSTSDGSLHLGFRGRDVYMGFWGNDSSTPGISKGEWHHMAWRYTQSSGNQDIFIDGVLKHSSPNHGPYGRARILLVGRTSYNAGAFCGSISDARVYNVALADADIAAVAASPP
jgi:Concanavalin A-like lectin/glucanases superfamily